MSVSDVIRNRRCIRSYSSRKVSKQTICEVLESAAWAPSAHNAQPWRFIVLTKIECKRNLAEAMAETWMTDLRRDNVPPKTCEDMVNTSVKRFTYAPVLIVACLTMQDMMKYPNETRQTSEHDLAVQSLGAAVQNMLLTAYSKGLGACWFCAPIFCKEVVRKTLAIPEMIEPQALITLGYPAEDPEVPPRKSLQAYSFASHWGKSYNV